MIKSKFIFKNSNKLFAICPLRNYMGKHLTSYQKKIYARKSKIVSIEPDKLKPTSLIAKLAVSNDISVIKHMEDSENEKKNFNLDLIEASNVYLAANPDYRKLLFYGSENKNIKSTNFTCHGCGGNINCESVHNPGFIPNEIYEVNRENEIFMKNILCMRCFYLENDLNPLDISLDKDIYYDIISKNLQQYQSGIIILLADLSDLPFSIPSDFDLNLFTNFRIVLVGNKCDLLSKVNRQIEWYEKCLIRAAEERGIPTDLVEFVHIVSAKDCNRLEGLIDRLLSPNFLKNEPIFLVGSTNSGKSSIFNRFLKSDMCKTIAKSHIQAAMVSNLPGTTLNLLRFPMTNISPVLMNRRIAAKKMISRGEIESSVEAKYPVLESSQLVSTERQMQSFDELVTYSYNWDDKRILHNVYNEHCMRMQHDPSYLYDDRKITSNKWFFDTPGFINPDQLINYLDKECLSSFYSNEEMGVPRIYILKAGLSIIMENLARIDIVESQFHVYLSVHGRLPVELVDTYDIDRYYKENDHFTYYSFKRNLSAPLLAKIRQRVTDYDPEISVLPSLTPIDMDIATEGYNVNSADVVLSSIGWVGISGNEGGLCKIRAWTPASIGCCQRIPALIQDSVRRRLNRRAHSREFAVS